MSIRCSIFFILSVLALLAYALPANDIVPMHDPHGSLSDSLAKNGHPPLLPYLRRFMNVKRRKTSATTTTKAATTTQKGSTKTATVSLNCHPTGGITIGSGGTNPDGKVDGDNLLKASVKLASGLYSFKSVADESVLAMEKDVDQYTADSTVTTVKPVKNASGKIIEFSVYPYNSSTNAFYAAMETGSNCAHKILSTRWASGEYSCSPKGGYPDAAVLWQDEITEENKSSFSQIVLYKQLWLAVPSTKNDKQYLLVSTSHMYDMVPRCISNQNITAGTMLVECFSNSTQPEILWEINKVTGTPPCNLSKAIQRSD